MLKEVITVVKKVAQQEIMPRYLQVARQIKADGSSYTEADVATQKALLKALREIRPGAIMGEEMTREEQEKQWHEGMNGLWSVDPIDGTSNFLKGLPYFCISVAWMVQGKSVMGVVYNPVSDEMFYAEKGRGAFLNDRLLPINRNVSELSSAVANVDLKRLHKKLAVEVAAHPPYASQRNYGACALEWCYTAAGYFDLYLHGGQKPWDYAAGCLILEEAGGYMSGLVNDDYWSGSPWRRSVIAALERDLFLEWRNWVRAHQ